MLPWRPQHTARALRIASRRLSTVAYSTPIEKIIHDSIKTSGPMTVSSYMQLCLGHPTHGYYMNPENAVFGRKGDFITSPEISQVFGELVAIWHLSQWLDAGEPPDVRVVELGPGRGTLLADALRTWSQFPAFRSVLKEVSLVETSASMRKLQGRAVKSSLEVCKAKGMDVDKTAVRWYDSIEDIKDASSNEGVYTMVVAHEFFDALPVHVIEKGIDGWFEILITDTPDSTSKTTLSSSSPSASPPSLQFVRSPTPTAAANLLGALSPRYSSIPAGSRVEVSPASFKLVRQVADLLNYPASAGGSALVIDYGQDTLSESSLRAFKSHKIVSPLTSPGSCDLTANVDFALLREAIGNVARSHGPLTQHDFLTHMGIHARVAQLQQAARVSKKAEVLRPARAILSDSKESEDGAERIAKAARRLLDLTGMGLQYKVLGITGNGGREMQKGGKVWPFER